MVAPKIGFAPEATSQSAARDAGFAWRAWYKTARWQALRWDALCRDAFVCRMCGKDHPTLTPLCRALIAAGLDVAVPRESAPDFVADHIVAHKGNAGLFWNAGNLQCLCAGCHNSTKQAWERGRGGGGQMSAKPTER